MRIQALEKVLRALHKLTNTPTLSEMCRQYWHSHHLSHWHRYLAPPPELWVLSPCKHYSALKIYKNCLGQQNVNNRRRIEALPSSLSNQVWTKKLGGYKPPTVDFWVHWSNSLLPATPQQGHTSQWCQPSSLRLYQQLSTTGPPDKHWPQGFWCTDGLACLHNNIQGRSGVHLLMMKKFANCKTKKSSLPTHLLGKSFTWKWVARGTWQCC